MRLSTKEDCIWNTTHIIREVLPVYNLKTERWGWPLVQEKYLERKRNHNNRKHYMVVFT